MQTKLFQQSLDILKNTVGEHINDFLNRKKVSHLLLTQPIVVTDGGDTGYNTVISSVTKDRVDLTAGYEEESNYEDDGGGLMFSEMTIEQMIAVYEQLEQGNFESEEEGE